MAERRGVKRSFFSVETRYDPDEIIRHVKSLIDHPETVAAIGEIPDELKIKDCISFCGPSPSSTLIKVPRDLPEGPTEYYKALRKVLLKRLLEIEVDQRYEIVFGVSSVCKQGPHNIDGLRNLLDVICEQLMDEVPRNMVHQQARKESCKSLESEYTFYNIACTDSFCGIACPDSGNVQVLERHYGNTFEQVYLKALLVNEPGLVFAVGGIPYELRIEGGKSFSFPCPIFKFPRKMPLDPTLRHKVVCMVLKIAVETYGSRKLFLLAYKRAMGISSRSISEEEKAKEKTHNIGKFPPSMSMIEVNLSGPITKIPSNLSWLFL